MKIFQAVMKHLITKFELLSSCSLPLVATAIAILPEVLDQAVIEFSISFKIILTVFIASSAFFLRTNSARTDLVWKWWMLIALGALGFVGQHAISLGFRLGFLLYASAVVPVFSLRTRNNCLLLSHALAAVFVGYLCVDLPLPLVQDISFPRYLLYWSLRFSGLSATLCDDDFLAVSIEADTVLYRFGNEMFHPRFLFASVILFQILQPFTLLVTRFRAMICATAFFAVASIICASLCVHLEVYSHQRWTNASFFLQVFIGFISWYIISEYYVVAMPVKIERTTDEAIERPKNSWMYASAIYFAYLLSFSSIFFPDPGVSKQKRIVIHEHNSNWEPAWQDYNKFWFGSRVDYNYSLLARLLSCQYSVQMNHEPITDELADNTDIFFLKTPTSPFSPEEIRSLVRFVNNGGGLVVFGDHTNVFGSSKYLNELLVYFDLRIRYDSQYDSEDGGLTLWTDDAFVSHPTVKNIRKFLFGTGATISSSSSPSAMIVGANFTQPLDYAVYNFFMKEHRQAQQQFGEFSLCSTTSFGRGRICLFTDSTVISNFWVFYPGKPEFIHGVFDWVNRKNLLPLRIPRKSILFFAFVTLGLVCHRSKYLAPLLLGLATAIFLANFSLGYYYPNQDTQALSDKEVVFVDHGGEYFIAHSGLFSTPKDMPRYSSFYLTPARSGAVVRQVDKVSAAVSRKPRVIVFLKPTKILTIEERKLLNDYVEGGGNLLIGLHPLASAEVAKSVELLSGVAIEEGNIIVKNRSRSKQEDYSAKGWQLKGESTIIGDQEGTLCLVEKKNGRIIISTGIDAFEDKKIGGENSVPKLEQLGFRVIAQWLFDSILASNQESHLSEAIPFAEEFYDLSHHPAWKANNN